MTENEFDLIVLGAGSGGVRAANTAARLGAKVAIVEQQYYGGTCVNVGCVPKKLMVYASQYSQEMQVAQDFGWANHAADFNWKTFLRNKNQEINRLQNVYKQKLIENGISLIDGKASFVDANSIAVNGKNFAAQHIVIATGSSPRVPDIAGNDLAITSNDMFFLDQLPERLVIVGGGYIGVEFASIMNGLGVETTLCQRSDHLLGRFDKDIQKFIAQEMTKKGIKIHFNTTAEGFESEQNHIKVKLSNGQNLCADQVLLATGRKPNTSDLNLNELGVKLDKQDAIIVSEHYQTNISSIYAIGDVIDKVSLTPVAIAEGECLAENLFGGNTHALDYNLIPTAVFSQPNIATVGLTEAQAYSKHKGDIDVYHTTFKPMKFSLSSIEEKTLIKLVVMRSSDRVLGVHMVGPHAGEIIQGLAIAIEAGATKAIVDKTIGIHPTLAEEWVTL